MHNASRHGHLDLVKILLEVGVDVNARNADEETPLDNGIGSHVRDGNHESPLILAALAFGGHVEISRFLIENQADVNSVANEGRSSLLLSASRYGHPDVVQLLLNHGADVNSQEADLWASLHLASADGHLKVAELLIGHGAGVSARNEIQKTPLALASENGKLEIVGPAGRSSAVQVSIRGKIRAVLLHHTLRHGMDISVSWSCSYGRWDVEKTAKKTPLDLLRRKARSATLRTSSWGDWGMYGSRESQSRRPLEGGSQ